MNPYANVHYPTNSEAELDRLQRLAEQLAGFDETISLEWLDGAMTALAAGPRVLAVADWRDQLLGEAWERAFADPEADREAQATLQARWSVLLKQLDPELLMDAPDELRLAPVMLEWTDEDKARLVEEGEIAPGTEEDEIPRTGEVWAHGFMEIAADAAYGWTPPPEDDELAEVFQDAIVRVGLLSIHDEAELAQMLAELSPEETLTRDDVLQEALFAVQDLRCFWVDIQPKVETRRVGPQPGRNDPCPCGSGKKFKKCHGMT